MTKLLYNYCNDVGVVRDINFWGYLKHILVYSEQCGEGDRKEERIIIYYFLKKELKISDDSISIKESQIIDIHKHTEKEKFNEANLKHNITTVYFTNAFDINHILENRGLAEGTAYDIQKSVCFTPMIDLNKSIKTKKESYGAKGAEKEEEGKTNQVYFGIIQEYSEKMIHQFSIPYANYFSYNFLIARKYSPEEIKIKLPALDKFDVRVIEFGEYLKDQNYNGNLSNFDKSVFFIRKLILEHLYNESSKQDEWYQIYVNILCELILYMEIFKDILEKDEYKNEFEEAYGTIRSDIALKNLMESKQDDKKPKIQLLLKIRGINKNEVNFEILDEILNDYKKKGEELKLSNWYDQIFNFKETYKEVKKMRIKYSISRTNNRICKCNIENKKVKNTPISYYIDWKQKKLINFLLEQYQDPNSIYGRMLTILPRTMSSGENALINIFASLHRAIKLNSENNILLIIDEIDAFLHPRWQQEILSDITEWISKGKEFKGKEVQLVFASHSPIILSDITADRVIRLMRDKNKSNENSSESNINHTLTFGANINSLFCDSFFMDQGSIGEIAKRKIKQVLEYLANPQPNNEKEIEYIINNIREPFVRRKLKNQFEQAKVNLHMKSGDRND